jgi:hypothetical protein
MVIRFASMAMVKIDFIISARKESSEKILAQLENFPTA